jgi:hypothetical protein
MSKLGYAIYFTLLFPISQAYACEDHPTVFASAENVSVTGTVNVLSVDNFKKGKSERRIYLTDDATGMKYELHFQHSAPAQLDRRAKVKVKGRLSGADIFVDVKDGSEVTGAGAEGSNSSAADSLASGAAAGPTDRKVLVTILSSNDSTALCSSADLNDMMFTNVTGSVNYMYRQASREKLSMSGNVYENVKLNINTNGLCDDYGWANSALAQLQAMGVNTSGYNHYLYVMPTNSNCNSGWGEVGGSNTWINGAYCQSREIYAHELGHNLGMNHARAVQSDGSIYEYGDYSDVMGGLGPMKMFSSVHSEYMGWTPTNKISYAGVGTFNIAPMEADPASTPLPLIAKVKLVSGEYYYLSYRKPIGFDANLDPSYMDRLSIHKGPGSYSLLVQMLGDGETYSDAANGLTIHVNSHAADAINVTVTGSCAVNAPTVTISPAVQGAHVGVARTYSVNVKNNDSALCAESTFNVASALPAGFSGSLSAPTVTVGSGLTGSVSLTLASPASASGSYALGAAIADSAQVIHKGSATASYVIDNTAPSSVKLSLRNYKGGYRQLTWNAATDNVDVVKYQVLRSGVVIAEVTTNTFAETNTSTSFTYQIRTFDSAGNSSLSNVISVRK